MCKRIGITGGIGAGKSVVSRLLRLKGYRVYDCDSEAKRIMETDPDLRKALIKLLGENAYSGACLNRKHIADIIFTDSHIREKINGLVHAAVRKDFLRYARNAETPVFVETAILSTGGFLPLVDEIWLVEAPENVRIERVRKRNGLPEKEILERMQTQQKEFDNLPMEKTEVIVNDGESSIWNRVNNLLMAEDE
ncbi:MAG: dephospho-CoA kinase, partial [Muribaculaceae bacterium]|nr:dephospho-CoA kinase [Muribaculaceae bacterium]